MANKNRPTARKTPAKASEPYVSFNKDEWRALQKLGFRERWAYMQFKWLANFETGMMGNFRKQRLSYQDLADLVTAPGVQGRGMGNIDDTQAADFMVRLAAAGLVVQHAPRSNGGLLFELPLSPRNRKSSALQTNAAAPAVQPQAGEFISPEETLQESRFFPDDNFPPFDDLPATTPVFEGSNSSLSVLALTKLKNNTDGARAANADAAPPSRATGAAAAPENLQRHPSAAAPLTSREIHEVIAGDWTFFQTGTPEAWTLYASWAGAGITLDDLHAAMASLEEEANGSEITPMNLNPKLWPKVVDGWVDQLAA